MKILAFLQNQWFKDPERMKQIRQREPWVSRPRHEWNATWLFFGCLTGQRLQSCLGEPLCEEIIWEEVSPEIGGRSSSAFPADLAHIRAVLDEHQPTHVIAFGRIAEDALRKLSTIGGPNRCPWRLLCAPHPAARGTNVVRELKALGELLGQELEPTP